MAKVERTPDGRIDRSKHSPFCSKSRLPCSCQDWPKCAAEMFPNLKDACPALCPIHGED